MITELKLYLDLETTDVIRGAGVWEIGALAVVDGVSETFYGKCRPTGSISLDTIAWINSKPEVAERYHQALSADLTDLELAEEFANWLNERRGGDFPDRNEETVFSWGIFDFPILGALYKRLDQDQPWHYGSECDLRSVAKFIGSETRPNTSQHHALNDATALEIAHNLLVDDMHRLCARNIAHF